MSAQKSLFDLSVIDPAGDFGIAQLRSQCEQCVRCPLAASRKQALLGNGRTSSPDICFVGEAPGYLEDERGTLFVGPAGQVLDKMVAALGYTRETVYVCNAVACRPPGNRPPEKGELDACYPFLLGQLRAVRPQVVVALGETAVHAMIGGKKKITELRGKWFDWEGWPVMPTFHPAQVARSELDPSGGRDIKKSVWADLQQVLTRLGKTSP